MWKIKFLRSFTKSPKKKLYRSEREHQEKIEILRRIADNLGEFKSHLDGSDSNEHSSNSDGRLSEEDYLNLRIKEYEALRAEQRTRLDAANKLIHYNVLVIGFVIAGLIAGYRQGNMTEFNNALLTALLLIPLLSMPFTFTQWNDEIIVDNIGRYLEKVKEQITYEGDPSYWRWEEHHNSEKPVVLKITAAVRSGLFPIFALCSLIAHPLYFIHVNNGYSWKHYLIQEPLRGLLLIGDVFLIILAFSTVWGMKRRKDKRSKYYKELKIRQKFS